MGNCCTKDHTRKSTESSGRGSHDTTRKSKFKHPMVKKITDEFEFAMIIKEHKIVVADFFAPWCGPCQIFSPQVERFAEEFSESVAFVKINVDDCEELAESYDVSSLPKFIIFKDGEKVDEFQGTNPLLLRNLIALHVAPEESDDHPAGTTSIPSKKKSDAPPKKNSEVPPKKNSEVPPKKKSDAPPK